MAPPEADPFRCEILHEHDGARIRPFGELDVATAPLLRAELDALRNAGHRHLIVDLGRLSFIDSSGLRCILACDAEARNDGFSIALIPRLPRRPARLSAHQHRGAPAVHRALTRAGAGRGVAHASA